MFCKISQDVKIATLNLYESDILRLEDILACVGFFKCTFYQILKFWKETGDVVTHRHANKGSFRLLHHDDIQYLLRLIRHRPDWFLDELLGVVTTNLIITTRHCLDSNCVFCHGKYENTFHWCTRAVMIVLSYKLRTMLISLPGHFISIFISLPGHISLAFH